VQRFHSKGLLIGDFGGGGGTNFHSVIDSYSSLSGSLTHPLSGDYIVYGNDGRVAWGPDHTYVKVRSDPYKGYPGVYHGASSLVAYNQPITKGVFEYITGIKVQDHVRTSTERYRMILDVIKNSHPFAQKSFKILRLTRSRSWYGYAESYTGRISLVPGAGISTLDHEIGHMVEWKTPRAFDSWWDASGGYDNPLTRGYGYNRGEKVSTFREKIHDTHQN